MRRYTLFHQLVAATSILLFGLAAASSSNPPLEPRQCQARWEIAASLVNAASLPLKQEFRYIYGLTSGNTGPDALRIASVSVSFRHLTTENTSVSELHGDPLTRSIEVRHSIDVVPHVENIFVWQLVAQYADITIKLPNIEILQSSQTPANDSIRSCTLVEVIRRRVEYSTSVRLRHKNTGLYMNSIIKSRWQYATLGSSREFTYNLQHTGGSYFKIRTEQPNYSGYVNAYCAWNGGVYFDWTSSNEKQYWLMSTSSPKDGDVVTFRNRYYPTAGLLYDSTNGLACENRSYFDEWVIEVV